MSFQHKSILMIGATAGIGAAMADRLVEEGAFVVAIGRRQERLDDFVRRHGTDKAASVRFDIGDKQGMDHFVQSVTTAYPNIDCVFLNAGVQSQVKLTEPSTVDLAAFHDEVTTNFTSFVDLTMKFLPFLQAKKTQTSLIYTGAHLALIPASTMPSYSASKAALSAFVWCLREQLDHAHSTVKVVELCPPLVQTELHDYMGPTKGRAMGMPLDQFTDAAYKGLVSGSDHVIIGAAGPKERYDEIVRLRRAQFDGLSEMMRRMA